MASETARCVSFKGLPDDGGQYRMMVQDFAPAFDLLIKISNGWVVNPIAVLHPGFHLLGDLASVLLALQCPLRGHDGFDELTFGRFIELEVQTFDSCAAFAERFA
ncbi:MAG: hypothetical protein AAFR71_07730 [Pseudomonadota bacterium]